jgi:hypothetical protein
MRGCVCRQPTHACRCLPSRTADAHSARRPPAPPPPRQLAPFCARTGARRQVECISTAPSTTDSPILRSDADAPPGTNASGSALPAGQDNATGGSGEPPGLSEPVATKEFEACLQDGSEVAAVIRFEVGALLVGAASLVGALRRRRGGLTALCPASLAFLLPVAYSPVAGGEAAA